MTSRDVQAQQTRRRLLNKSIELIVSRGYDHVTVGEICRACQVAKGTFYVHFDSKRDILMAILADLNVAIGSRIDALAPADPRTTVEHAVLVHLESIQREGKEFTRALLHALLAEQVGPDNPSTPRRIGAITRALARAQDEGTIRDDRTPAQLVGWLESFILGLMFEWCQVADEEFAGPALAAVQTFLDSLFLPRAARAEVQL